MRLLRFAAPDRARIGVVEGDIIYDVKALEATLNGRRSRSDGRVPDSMETLLSGGPSALDAVRELVEHGRTLGADDARAAGVALAREECRVLLPVAANGKIICVGRNYLAHAEEAGKEVPPAPALFLRSRSTLVPHAAPLVRPVVSEQFDWEGELAVVIGRAGRHVSREDAWELVAGYTAFNDGSLRDYQWMSAQWMPGKNFDSSGSFGPELVPADDVPSIEEVRLTSRVNGELMQSAKISELIFDIPSLIEFLSRFTLLQPGDVIATGTPAGVGAFRSPPHWLDEGDKVTIELEGITTLENPVVREVAGG